MTVASDLEGRTLRLVLQVAAERQDELVAELWALGTSGIEIVDGHGVARLVAYFAPGNEPETSALQAISTRCAAELVEGSLVEPTDWLAEYRAVCEPIEVGPLVIDSREPIPVDSGSGGREVVRVPARNAFGTGSHESTRLVLEALVDRPPVDQSVLDVGTGSAVLSLVALRLGALRAVGFDIDIGSVITAADNARLNQAQPLLLAGTAGALGGDFDLVLVNILPHRWLPSAGEVVQRVAADGEMIVSGLLASEAEDVIAELEGHGLRLVERRELADWASLRLAAGSQSPARRSGRPDDQPGP